MATALGNKVTFSELPETEITVGIIEIIPIDTALEIPSDATETDAADTDKSDTTGAIPNFMAEFETLGRTVNRLVVGRVVGRAIGRDVIGTLAVANKLET